MCFEREKNDLYSQLSDCNPNFHSVNAFVGRRAEHLTTQIRNMPPTQSLVCTIVTSRGRSRLDALPADLPSRKRVPITIFYVQSMAGCGTRIINVRETRGRVARLLLFCGNTGSMPTPHPLPESELPASYEHTDVEL